MSAASASARAKERAWLIVDIIRTRSGEELTMVEIASACNRSPGRGFTNDLALARHLALDVGERITECAWSTERRCYTLFHLRAGREDGKGIAGILRHGADVATRARNLERHSTWEVENAERSRDRRLANIGKLMGGAAALQGEAFAEIAKLVRDDEGVRQ